ncbi:DinB family protein [Paraflavitalea speifideaquila]|nr:DinB family protein [Paraflavitalea speifideiaquila]
MLQQPAAGKWSVAQAIEHLNSYGRYYLPLMQKA